MNFRNVTAGKEPREEWRARVLAVYPDARFYRYADGGECATGDSPFQPHYWSPAWRVGQWSRDWGGTVHVPENLKLHLAAVVSRGQWLDAYLHVLHGDVSSPSMAGRPLFSPIS